MSQKYQIHILLDDTFGDNISKIEGISCKIFHVPTGNEAEEKLNYIKRIGSDFIICIGHGRSDSLILKDAKLGIACYT